MIMHASFNDIGPILDLIEEAHGRSETYQGIPFNRDRTRASLESIVPNPRCLVAFNGDGVLIATATDALWHDGMLIADLFFYARRNGLQLIREYKAWAKAFPGNNEITLGVTFGGEAGRRTENLYQRLGFEQSGTYFRVNT